jgi:ribosomal-protein-alanine N-acetyltransferase
MAIPCAQALLAQQGIEPVAFALLRRAADEAEILTIATRPAARRQGHASRLIAAAMASLDGVNHLFIEVASANAAARAFYAKLGFKPAGERKGYYRRADGRCDDAVIMRKDLAA